MSMKLHIVFELDCLPETGLADVTAVTQLAAASFEKACAPLGTCILRTIRSADVKAQPTLEGEVKRALTGGS
jgi:hypothetical protein